MTTTDVGPNGVYLAQSMADKAIAAIDGFPASTEAERRGIAAIVASRLVEYANGEADASE